MRGPSLPRRRFRGARFSSSSETQGQIVGTRESLNGRKNVARRKVKSGEKSSSRRSLLFFVTCRSLLFFVPYIFFRPFRLSLAPTICPWVSEDCFTSVGPGTGARFSKVPIINGPGKLSPFTLKIEVSIVLHLTR